MLGKEQYLQTSGVITQTKSLGLNHPTMLTVTYKVNNVTYTIRESIKLRSEPIKIGPLTIGQKKKPVLGQIHPGKEVVVCYDPTAPQNAFLRDNHGIMNA